jgi:hypothetical protein
VESNAIEKESRNKQIKAIIERLKEMNESADPGNLKEDKKHPLSWLQEFIVDQYINLHGYVERERLFTLIEEAAEQRDRRKLNNLFYAAYYFTIDGHSMYKRLVRYHIPLGKIYSPEELLDKWNAIFLENGLLDEFETETQAIRFTKLHYKTTKKRGSGCRHTIVKENPFGFELIKPKVTQDEMKRPRKKKKAQKGQFTIEVGRSLLKSFSLTSDDDFTDEPDISEEFTLTVGKSLVDASFLRNLSKQDKSTSLNEVDEVE